MIHACIHTAYDIDTNIATAVIQMWWITKL